MARAHRSLSCGLVYRHRSLTSIMEAKRLSSYAEVLGGNARTRYLEKLQFLNGVDPFLLTGTTGTERSDSAATQNLPPVEASDLVSFLVLETSFVTAKQLKAHKSMEAYNQFVSGWVKDVSGWTVNQKIVVTGRVSYHT